MAIYTPPTKTVLNNDNIEQRWVSLYLLLLPLVTRWVYSAQIYSWKGQENDIALDIVQVTVLRMFEYDLKMQSKDISIGSFQGLSITIAKNYLQDLRRKDSRLQPLNRDGFSQLEYTLQDEKNSSEVILDKVDEEQLFQEIAKKVVNFPNKLRRAMLIDISRRMDFDTQSTPLQEAFLKVGIHLEEYIGLMPEEPVLRSRHSSLVSLGYRKLKMLFRNYCTCGFVAQALRA
jgi:DNA-directed RNA polymerase specialized sigma24 family protein